MEISPPLSRRDVTFDSVADVIVVGMGAAGACAAIEAKEAGADVLVIERTSGGGGSSAMAGGYVYFGGGTRVQKANGFEDSPQEMFKYIMAVTPEPNAEKIRLYCDHSVAHFDWMERQGVPFNDRFFPGKDPEHPEPTRPCPGPATRRPGRSRTSPSLSRAATRSASTARRPMR